MIIAINITTKLMADTTHQVQKARRTNACIAVKYRENRNPIEMTVATGQNGHDPATYSESMAKMRTYMPRPAYGFGMPKVRLYLLYCTLWHHSSGKKTHLTGFLERTWEDRYIVSMRPIAANTYINIIEVCMPQS